MKPKYTITGLVWVQIKIKQKPYFNLINTIYYKKTHLISRKNFLRVLLEDAPLPLKYMTKFFFVLLHKQPDRRYLTIATSFQFFA